MKLYKYLLVFIFLFIPLSSVLADDFTIQPDEVSAFDTRIISGTSANVNYGTNPFLGIGENNSSSLIQRSLSYFDLSSIPSNSVLSDVEFSLWVYSDLSDNSRTAYCSRLLYPFVESQATWNIRSTGNNWLSNASGSDVDEVNTLLSAPLSSSMFIDSEVVFVTWNLPEWQKFIDGTYTNYGFSCRMATENNDLYTFHSSSSTDASMRPKLRITYSLPDTPTPTVTYTYTSTPSQTPTQTNTPEFTLTPSFTPEFTLTPSFTPEFTFTPSFTPTFTLEPTFTSTPEFTATPTITPTSTPTGFPSEMGLSYYLLLVIPLLFIDWQTAVIWAFFTLSSEITDFFLTLPFEGFEIWFLFLIVSFMRLFFFRNRL